MVFKSICKFTDCPVRKLHMYGKTCFICYTDSDAQEIFTSFSHPFIFSCMWKLEILKKKKIQYAKYNRITCPWSWSIFVELRCVGLGRSRPVKHSETTRKYVNEVLTLVMSSDHQQAMGHFYSTDNSIIATYLLHHCKNSV